MDTHTGPRLSSKTVLSHIRKKRSKYWEAVREARMLSLFKDAAERVPAYKDFLQKNSVRPESVASLSDFAQVPPVTKANYLREYPMKDLCWDGSMEKPYVFAATSGSTGKPFYFPRTPRLVEEYSILTELFLDHRPANGPVLVLICFGMGVWIGGVFTFQAFEETGKRGRGLSILTPGLNKGEIFHALRELAPNFAQTILVGYPPFIKDVLDEASMDGIDLKALDIRLLFAAESFNEQFRDHVAALASIKNLVIDTLNIYGTADIGAMAWETPTSIALRRYAVSHPGFFKTLFGEIDKTPTLAQYNPYFTNFEAADGQIYLTGDNGIPLLRYAVGDRGGVHSFTDVARMFPSSHTLPATISEEYGAPLYELPFVHVYERIDFSVKLSGAIIYPEPIRDALQDEELQKSITGRFTLLSMKDDAQNPYLQLHVEMRRDIEPNEAISNAVAQAAVKHLLAKNSEYHAIYSATTARAIPRVLLWKHEDPTYFPSGIKQRWVINQK